MARLKGSGYNHRNKGLERRSDSQRLDEIVDNFISHSDATTRLRYARKLAARHTPTQKHIGAKMLVEVAASPGVDGTVGIEHIAEAKELWDKVAADEKRGAGGIKSLGGEALIHLANVPLYQFLFAAERIPPVEKLGTVYENLLWATGQNLDAQERYRGTSEGAKLTGNVAVGSVSLLFLRMAIQTDEPVVAIPALFSNTRLPQTARSNVDIYSGTERGIVLEHGLQVRATQQSRELPPVNPGLTRVNISSDLGLGNKDISYGAVAFECQQEFEGRGNPNISALLDARTEKLIDLIR